VEGGGYCTPTPKCGGTRIPLTPPHSTPMVRVDFESQRQYELVVFAVELSQPDFTAVCDVTVTVDDVSDRRPRFVFPSPGGGDHVTVTVDAGGPLDQVVCTLRADDDDDDDRLTFRLVSDHADDPVNFHLDPVTGRLRITADRLQVCFTEYSEVDL